MELRPVSQRGACCLQALDRGVHFLGGGGRVSQEGERVEVAWLLAKHEDGLVAGLLPLPAEEIDPSELDPHFTVVGGELLRLQEVLVCLPQLA